MKQKPWHIELTGGVPYTEVLRPEQWEEMKMFLRVVSVAGRLMREKNVAINGIIRAWHYNGGIDIEVKGRNKDGGGHKNGI